jgi:hypothetical protein
MFICDRTVATGFLPVPAITGLMLIFATGFGTHARRQIVSLRSRPMKP